MIDEKIAKIAEDTAYMRGRLDNFITETFDAHCETDKETAEAAKAAAAVAVKTANQVKKVYWSVGAITAFVGFVEAAHALGFIH